MYLYYQNVTMETNSTVENRVLIFPWSTSHLFPSIKLYISYSFTYQCVQFLFHNSWRRG